jgi:hypothetical protein
MRLRDLRDIYLGQDIYIVGSGPTAGVFPKDFLINKICISLNDSYKMHPGIGPIALMHHENYARVGGEVTDAYHPNFQNIKYPVIKASGKVRLPDEIIDFENSEYCYYDWSHEISKIWTITKETDLLYYTPEGCSLHAALQLAWIMGAANIFVIGCDSSTLGGKHYASYDKNGFRDDEVLKRGQRNYDSYVYGTLIVQKFLESKGVNVMNLSPVIGYHLVDYQYDFFKNKMNWEEPLAQLKVNEGNANA